MAARAHLPMPVFAPCLIAVLSESSGPEAMG
jgi:hypothetical protein